MARQIDTNAEIDAIRLADQGGDPASPAAGYKLIYAKSGGLYLVDSAGTVTGPFTNGDTPTNEVMNYPPMIGIDVDLDAQGLWWDKIGTPTTAVTLCDVAGEAGITETYEYALYTVADGATEGFYQRYTYADQPRIKSGLSLSAVAAIWVKTAGRTVTMSLETSAATSKTATATAQAWTIVKCEDLTLDGTYVDLKFTIDGADTFYVVPLGVNIGENAYSLPQRGLRYVHIDNGPTVKTLTGLADEATWTDVDCTASSSPLACIAKLRSNILHTNATGWDLGFRRNGETTAIGANTLVNCLSNANTTERSVTEVTLILDDGQIFEYYLDRWTGASTLAEGTIILSGFWEWA